MRTLKRFVASLAVVTVGLWSGSTVAHGATTEFRVVSAFMYQDATDQIVNADSGWSASGEGTGKVEIGSAYGAPDGLGREAVMLDTPAVGDRATVYALPDAEGYYTGAFTEAITITPDRQLGFWLYRSSASTPGSTPVLEAWVAKYNQHVIITFDPSVNGYTAVGTWMYVDATAEDARWTVAFPSGDTLDTTLTWPDVITYTAFDFNGTHQWGVVDYGLQFRQEAPGSSAIDGVTVSTLPGSTMTNFELLPASGRPLLDDCKNEGWRAHPAGPFKNQGDCISAIVAAH